MARHLPHDTARNARFLIGILNAAEMGILSAGQHCCASSCMADQHPDAPILRAGADARRSESRQMRMRWPGQVAALVLREVMAACGAVATVNLACSAISFPWS